MRHTPSWLSALLVALFLAVYPVSVSWAQPAPDETEETEDEEEWEEDDDEYEDEEEADEEEAAPESSPAPSDAPAPAGNVDTVAADDSDEIPDDDTSEEAAPAPVAEEPAEEAGPPPNLTPGQVHAWEANQLVDRGELAGAEAKASLAKTTEDGLAGGHYALSRIRLRKGEYEDAIIEVRSAIDADPKFAPAQLLFIRLQAKMQRTGELIEPLEQLTIENPDNLALLVALSEAQLADTRA